MKRFEKITLLRTPGALGFTMSRTSTIVPFTGPVAVTINEHQWDVVVETASCFVCYRTHPSAGVRMERIWPNAVHRQTHAKPPFVRSGGW